MVGVPGQGKGRKLTVEQRKKIEEKVWSQRRGQTFEVIYGDERAADIKKRVSETNIAFGPRPWGNDNLDHDRAGKTYEEIYGNEADLNRASRREGNLARHCSSRFYSTRYMLWRHHVLSRDKSTCQKCGVVSPSNDAHHIVSWDDSEELRFNVDNGRTLCRSCHNTEHPR